MSSTVFRRCGCRDENGKQYGVLSEQPTEAQLARACPKMARDPKHGFWTYRISNGAHPVTGKRVVINGKAHASARAAKIALRKDLVAKDENMLQKPSSETVATYAAKWLPRRRTTGTRPLKDSTAANYQRYIDQDIAPSALGRTKLPEVRRSDVVAFLDALVAAGRGATTVNRILAVVQSILTGAVKDELIPVNVARGVEGPTVARGDRELWETSDLEKFLTASATHRLGSLFELALYTALRRGEVTGLRWDDVDLGQRVVRIRHNRVKIDAVVAEQTTKSAASTAVLALPDEAVTALTVWKLRQDLERAEWDDAWQETGYVFTMEDGRPLDPPYVTRLFDKIRLQAGLPKLTFHGLRHLAATFMWEDGQDIARVSKALRHSSVGVTSEVYTHMTAKVQRETLSAIGNRLRRQDAHTVHTQEAK